MLVIRDAQLAALGQASRERFEDRTVTHLVEKYPQQFATRGQPANVAFVRRMIALGQSHRILSEGALLTFIDLVVEFGEKFERSPERAWAQKILAHPRLPDHLRMETIRQKFDSRTDGRILVPHNGGA